MGKGYAVKVGMHCARGQDLLMVDADGATCISDFDRLLASPHPVVFGSRHHLKDDAVARRSFIRTVLMYGFHTLLRILIGPGPQDTQCGFKLFRRDAARVLFANQRLPRWSFDVELVILSAMCGIEIGEVPVNWVEIPGSKLNIITASLQMLRDIIALRLFYTSGVWRPVR